MIEAPAAERIADSIAEDGRAVLVEFFGEKLADGWAGRVRSAVRSSMQARDDFRAAQRARTEMLAALRGQQKDLPTREARRKFDHVLQRIARATQMTGGEA